jgi:hypothetical protein
LGFHMRRPPLGREVSLALLLKLAALAALYWFFFGPSHRPVIDTAQLAAHLIGPMPSNDTVGGRP